MANNGRGENEQKNNFSGSLKDNHTNEQGVAVGKNAHPTAEEANISGSLKEENQPTVGWATQITNNATGVDNENVSGNLKDNHTNEQGVAVGKNAHPTAEEANISGNLNNDNTTAQSTNNFSGSLKENAPLDLPELNTQNWYIIVQKLTPELGANVLLAQHSSLVKVEDNQITLSVHKSGELFCKPAHLSALGEVLARHYGTQQKIQLIEWQDNFENASQAKQRHKEEEQQQRLQTLQQDPFAQKLQQVFGGEWTVK